MSLSKTHAKLANPRRVKDDEAFPVCDSFLSTRGRRIYYHMERNPFKWPLSVLFGFLIIFSELIFTFRAYSLWPAEKSGRFSIFENWHSDLGSSLSGFNSVEGSFYHNIGIAIQGLALIMFCGGLYISDVAETPSKKCYLVAQLFGIAAGFSFLMAGIYSLDLENSHKFWASAIFISILPFIGILSYHFAKSPGNKKWIGFYGYAAVFVDFVFALTFISPARIYILEYFAMIGIYFFILLVTMNLFLNEVLIIRVDSSKQEVV
ncbi:MAG: hypothetical protein ACXAB4_13165 [Candidatus Hodarchaeales archaeon]|jgi:hypothetical protein